MHPQCRTHPAAPHQEDRHGGGADESAPLMSHSSCCPPSRESPRRRWGCIGTFDVAFIPFAPHQEDRHGGGWDASVPLMSHSPCCPPSRASPRQRRGCIGTFDVAFILLPPAGRAVPDRSRSLSSPARTTPLARHMLVRGASERALAGGWSYRHPGGGRDREGLGRDELAWWHWLMLRAPEDPPRERGSRGSPRRRRGCSGTYDAALTLLPPPGGAVSE